ncbi:MAG: hypothetical protein NVS1B2_16100 [Vulcanimicrobiaceae bacterium]
MLRSGKDRRASVEPAEGDRLKPARPFVILSPMKGERQEDRDASGTVGRTYGEGSTTFRAPSPAIAAAQDRARLERPAKRGVSLDASTTTPQIGVALGRRRLSAGVSPGASRRLSQSSETRLSVVRDGADSRFKEPAPSAQANAQASGPGVARNPIPRDGEGRATMSQFSTTRHRIFRKAFASSFVRNALRAVAFRGFFEKFFWGEES